MNETKKETSSASDQSVVRSRFMVFGGCNYYAIGGLNDFIASFESLEDALEFAENPSFDTSVYKWKYFKTQDWDWWHVFDITCQKIVAQSQTQAYGHETGGACLSRLLDTRFVDYQT